LSSLSLMVFLCSLLPLLFPTLYPHRAILYMHGFFLLLPSCHCFSLPAAVVKDDPPSLLTSLPYDNREANPPPPPPPPPPLLLLSEPGANEDNEPVVPFEVWDDVLPILPSLPPSLPPLAPDKQRDSSR